MPRIDFGSIFIASMMFIIIFMVGFLMVCHWREFFIEKFYTPETIIMSEISETSEDTDN